MAEKAAVNCEYLSDNKLCKAIAEGKEGKTIREKSCTNEQKDFCCYLCDNQPSCYVSCNYLARKQTIKSIKSERARSAQGINRQIKEYEKKIASLTALFDEGKIGDQQYANSVVTLEDKITELEKSLKSLSLPEQTYNFEKSDEAPMERPTAACVLALIGGILGIIVGAFLLFIGAGISDYYQTIKTLYEGVGLWGIFCGLIVIGAGSKLYSDPRGHTKWGAVILAFSIFGLSTLLGLIGGILALVWKPTASTTPSVQNIIRRVCPKCGRVLGEDDKFCPRCGKVLG